MKDKLTTLLKANCPVTIIRTLEEPRTLSIIYDVVKTLPMSDRRQVLTWDIISGIRQVNPDTFEEETPTTSAYTSEDTTSPVGALGLFIASKSRDPQVMIMKDPHPYMGQNGSPEFIRQLRNASYQLSSSLKNLILVVPYLTVPVDLENNVYVIDLDLPKVEAIKELLAQVLQGVNLQLREMKKNPIVYDDAGLTEYANTLVGLTEDQIENLAAISMAQSTNFSKEFFTKEKAEILRRNSNLEFATPMEQVDSMGGLHGFKEWLNQRKLVMSDKARKFGIRPNLSMLTVGPPGTGKSLSSRICASFWGVPMIRFNLGELMNKYVGESEGRLNNALKIIEAAAPCLLEIDEIEKSFAQSSEDGVGRRMLGKFLTWFQELDKPVFINATANDVTALPPELVNRFETVMYFPLPNHEERKDIWAIKLKELDRDPRRFDIQELVECSEKYTGRDIVKCLNNALYIALNSNSEDLTTEHIKEAMKNVNPISMIDPKKIEFIVEWAKNRAVNASTTTVKDSTTVVHHRPLNLN